MHILLYRACSQASIESKPWANLHAGNNVVFNMWVANVRVDAFARDRFYSDLTFCKVFIRAVDAAFCSKGSV